jgi:hypothetical protein
MADGSCMDWTSSRLFNDRILKTNGIPSENNLNYRQWLQMQSPDVVYPPFTCTIEPFTNKDFSIIENTNVLTQPQAGNN